MWNIGFFRQRKGEKIHFQETFIVRNVKGNSSGRRKMIIKGNMNLHKGMKNIRIRKYVGNTKDFLFLNFSKR